MAGLAGCGDNGGVPSADDMFGAMVCADYENGKSPKWPGDFEPEERDEVRPLIQEIRSILEPHCPEIGQRFNRQFEQWGLEPISD